MPELDVQDGRVLIEDFDDIELELTCSDREMTVGGLPSSEGSSLQDNARRFLEGGSTGTPSRAPRAPLHRLSVRS